MLNPVQSIEERRTSYSAVNMIRAPLLSCWTKYAAPRLHYSVTEGICSDSTASTSR